MSRVVAVGVPHHIMQRGALQVTQSNGGQVVTRQEIFVSDALRRVYLQLLKEHAEENHLRILAYCLMNTHLHLVVIPEAADSMAKTFRNTHTRFAQYCNADLWRAGRIWQSRYYSCPVEETAVGQVIAYVENNPVRRGEVQEAGDFLWSSARAHLGMDGEAALVDKGLFMDLLDLNWWKARWNQEEWAQLLARTQAEDWTQVRAATFGGRPLGSPEFIAELEARLGRRLVRMRVGRPRKMPPGKELELPALQRGAAV